MPNWCLNDLTVSGDAKELKRFVKANMGLPAKYPPVYGPDGQLLFDSPDCTEKYFCFNALVPVPQEVLDVGFDGHDRTDENGKTLLDGYHWGIENWGTKWDVYANGITADEMGWRDGCENISFSFDTAWAPPEEWLKIVSDMFPSLTFLLHYEEPGGYFAGDIYREEGIVSVDEYEGDRLEDCLSEWLSEG